MDSTDDNAVTNEPEIRRTRSGRTVRPPLTPAGKQTQRKTRKKMVLVEVEVSEEEDDGAEDQNPSADASFSEQNSVDTESKQNFPEEMFTHKEDTTEEPPGNNPEVDDSNSALINDFHGDSSIDQNDSRSIPFSSKNDSELPSDQNSNQGIFANNIDNQDSTQNSNTCLSEEKSNEVKEFDVSVLNNDSQTQCKPDEKEEEVETKNGVNFISVRSAGSLFDSVDNDSKKESESVEHMETDTVDQKEESDSKKNQGEEEKMEDEPVKESSETQLEKSEDKPEKLETKKEKTDTEVISEDELPTVQAAKVPETEEVSDEELPGPKLAELPADTEVVSEDELPTVKKEGTKRKLEESEYDPGSPTSESEQSAAKKPALESSTDVKKEEKPSKPRKLPELDKYWKAVNDDPTDFTGWTYLLQYVDQENDMEAAREAYDAFLSHYPYCYGYWRKYADYEKRKGNKKKCEEQQRCCPPKNRTYYYYYSYIMNHKIFSFSYMYELFRKLCI